MKKILLQHKFWLTLTIFSVLGLTFSELLKAYTMQYILDSATIGSYDQFLKSLLLTGILIIIIFICGIFYDFCSNRFIKACMISVKKEWFETISEKELCEYDTQNASQYISNFTVDTTMLEEDYLRNFLAILGYLFTGIGSLVVILNVHYSFILFVLATFWIPLLVNHLWAGKITSSKMKASQSSGTFVASLKESLMGFEVSKLFSLSYHMVGIFHKKNQETEETRFQSRLTQDISSSCSSSTSLAIWLGSLLLGVYQVLNHVMSVGSVIQVNQLLNNLTTPLYRVSSCLTKMKAADCVYQRINANLEDSHSKEYLESEDTAQEIITGFSNQIDLIQIGLSHHERNILNQINIRFEKGKKYLLVGESGCGKSTIIKLLMNYYRDYDGSILIDNKNFKNIDKDSWYRCLSVVSQNDFVFHDTIENNITLFQSTSEKELNHVLEICCLTEFVASHQDKLDFIIAENGGNISGGERQRICLARALMRRSPVLILDEATSALDSETALRIEKNLLDLEGITLISISHKLFPEVVERYDSTIKIEKFVML